MGCADVKGTDMQHETTGDLRGDIEHSKTLRAGSDHYRAYVGPPRQYDFMGATQFRLLTALGLREDHHLLDLGCGSLRAGRFLIHYLLPEHYTGVEPNAWLWQDALDREIGHDIIALKRPRLLADDSFLLADVADASMDAVVAQSIYSHAGSASFARSLSALRRVLAPGGQILMTVILPQDPGFSDIAPGSAAPDWVYPDCVGYLETEVQALCDAAGLSVQRLDWFHPRQTWFRATATEAESLTPEMCAALGTGRPLLDARFQPNR